MTYVKLNSPPPSLSDWLQTCFIILQLSCNFCNLKIKFFNFTFTSELVLPIWGPTFSRSPPTLSELLQTGANILKLFCNILQPPWKSLRPYIYSGIGLITCRIPLPRYLSQYFVMLYFFFCIPRGTLS